jgi:hypothetical protein
MWFSDLDFTHSFAAAGEPTDPITVATALQRYRHTQKPSYKTKPESSDLSLHQLDLSLNALISDPAIADAFNEHHLFTLHCSRIPWTSTGVHINKGETISTFASGRLWRSKMLDLFVGPQFGLWFKIGVDGRVFNSTGASNTFTAETEGELYVANQMPGWFTNPMGGRVSDNLSAYHKTAGQFNILIVRWRKETSVEDVAKLLAGYSAPYPGGKLLALMERSRVQREASHKLPEGWSYLWFLGRSTTFSSELPYSTSDSTGTVLSKLPGISCVPNHTVSILRHLLRPHPLPFHPGTTISWSWLLNCLPSTLREDTVLTHDYLSLAVEFSNGRDLSYTWSCSLPKETGYWCPFPTWTDREHHVVVRSGQEGLGDGAEERRDVYADYVKYIEGGRTDEAELKARMPGQVVGVWLIATDLLQRGGGGMDVWDIRIQSGEDAEDVVQVL